MCVCVCLVCQLKMSVIKPTSRLFIETFAALASILDCFYIESLAAHALTDTRALIHTHTHCSFHTIQIIYNNSTLTSAP